MISNIINASQMRQSHDLEHNLLYIYISLLMEIKHYHFLGNLIIVNDVF